MRPHALIDTNSPPTAPKALNTARRSGPNLTWFAPAMCVLVLIVACDRGVPLPSSGSRNSVSPSQTWSLAPEALAAAVRFRKGVGLRSDEQWIREVEAAYGGPRPQPYGVALTPAEIAELDGRARNSDLVAPVVVDYGHDHSEEYGGVYVNVRGVVIGLFTANLDLHEAAIWALIHPEARFEVALSRWSEQQADWLRTRITAEDAWIRAHGGFVTGLLTDVPGSQVVLRLSVVKPEVVDAVRQHLAAGDLLRIEVTGEGGELLPRVNLRGRAVDSTGNPASGLEVELIPDVSGASGQQTGVVTDTEGWFLIRDIGATGYIVRLLRRDADENAELAGESRVVLVPGREGMVEIVVD